ncbi:DUF3073 domain-containing protein [uncultured Bifidobacterium sp.]|uniref:DUF3073 domain-containing protein n=1 Tax=uncultured Bifidobacterium sp. TaxID=165187 RepID=UPI0026395E84|nr:DUF3073 domain-containing protein [uncultured Bifidobacterium sp.]
MGRGRQKAKQQKIARKLKYLTTDTDYDELAKELKGEDPGTESVDPFADVEGHDEHGEERTSSDSSAEPSLPSDDLDEYARWAAEAAAKATSAEFPQTRIRSDHHAHTIMPMPRPHVSGDSKARGNEGKKSSD